MSTDLDKIVALCKRRGFIYPGSEIYGGLANTYDFGPMGVELLRNIQNLWWQTFVNQREDMFGLDSSVLMSSKVWEASGHVANFTDVMIDCKNCKFRTRADHLVEDASSGKLQVDGYTPEQLNKVIAEKKIHCPNCGKYEWTNPRKFNLLFETKVGILADSQSTVYLRGEIAQGMFTNFKNVLDSFSPKLPFGLAQQGKAFRNEVTKGSFIFRTLEFNLAELEYFFDPENDNWQKLYEYWKQQVFSWYVDKLGIDKSKLRWRVHLDQERAFYSQKTEDLDYEFPFGLKETFGLAYRTNYDLKNHMDKSGVDLQCVDSATLRKFIPHVIEPSFGINRILLMVLLDGYTEEERDGKKRVYLKINPNLAPYKAAVFPLLANKPKLTDKARQLYLDLKKHFMVAWDDRGNIGKRYASQDEIGTPYCITIDFQSLEDNTVTIRHRDTSSQERLDLSMVKSFIAKAVKLC